MTERWEYRERAKVRSRAADDYESVRGTFLREDPGHPLGVGMPMGETMREDGQSHYEAWQSVIRKDPCVYCGRLPADTAAAKGVQPPKGTIEHIEPKSKKTWGLGGAHSWLNLAGACERCNTKKADRHLLLWMLGQRGVDIRKPKHQKAKRKRKRKCVRVPVADQLEGLSPAARALIAREPHLSPGAAAWLAKQAA